MIHPRDMMTARINAALARYDEAVANGTWRTTARNQALDHILQGWDKTVTAATTAAVTEHDQRQRREREAAVRPLIDAIRNAR